MAAPATYIRTIQTSFTAAQSHSSSAWASAATASAQYHLNHHHHHLHHHHNSNANTTPAITLSLSHPQHPLNQPRHQLNQHHQHHAGYGSASAAPGGTAQGFTQSINTHNTHMYTHHLRDLTHSPAPRQQQPAGAAAPAAQGPTPPPGMVMTQQGQFIPQTPAPAPAQMKANPTATRAPPSPPPQSRRRSGAIRMPPSYRFDPFGDEPLPPRSFATTELSASSPPEPVPEAEVDIASASPAPTQLYTIHIPAAAPKDIQRYTAAPSASASPQGARARALSPRAASFTPSRPSTPVSSSTNQSFPGPNLSKIVAGIMLNRVHAVGKPMRRRVAPSYATGNGRQYVKSCLSSVVSVEA